MKDAVSDVGYEIAAVPAATRVLLVVGAVREIERPQIVAGSLGARRRPSSRPVAVRGKVPHASLL